MNKISTHAVRFSSHYDISGLKDSAEARDLKSRIAKDMQAIYADANYSTDWNDADEDTFRGTSAINIGNNVFKTYQTHGSHLYVDAGLNLGVGIQTETPKDPRYQFQNRLNQTLGKPLITVESLADKAVESALTQFSIQHPEISYIKTRFEDLPTGQEQN